MNIGAGNTGAGNTGAGNTGAGNTGAGAPGDAPVPAVEPGQLGPAAADQRGQPTEPREMIDCRGQRCPGPVIELARRIDEVPIGAVVRVLADDPAAGSDIPAWCRIRGQQFLGEHSLDEHSLDEHGRDQPGRDEPGPGGTPAGGHGVAGVTVFDIRRLR